MLVYPLHKQIVVPIYKKVPIT